MLVVSFFKITARTFYFVFIYVYLCFKIGSNIDQLYRVP